MHRMKCSSPVWSVLISERNDAWKWSTTPRNLLDLKRGPAARALALVGERGAPGAAPEGSLFISAAMNGLALFCMSTSRSCEVGSLFFERNPLTE